MTSLLLIEEAIGATPEEDRGTQNNCTNQALQL